MPLSMAVRRAAMESFIIMAAPHPAAHRPGAETNGAGVDDGLSHGTNLLAGRHHLDRPLEMMASSVNIGFIRGGASCCRQDRAGSTPLACLRFCNRWSMETAASRIRPRMASCQYGETSSRISELDTTDKSAMPRMVPEPPFKLAPPITAAAMMFSSMPAPKVQETVRAFCSGWYKQILQEMPVFENGYALPMAGAGLGTSLIAERFRAKDAIRICSRT